MTASPEGRAAIEERGGRLPLEEMEYVRFAEAFGWTPAEVDALPATVAPWYLPILDLLAEVRRAR